MKKLPILSSQEVVRVLRRVGFTYAPKRGKGSHLALLKIEETGRKLLVIVPKRKEIPIGTLLSIIEQAGLTRDEFIKFLRKP